ncbi:MAG: hypothetical protein JWR20_387 [Marmoricola sp.]|nr:hypothetical protein [Marmoricola sp.]
MHHVPVTGSFDDVCDQLEEWESTLPPDACLTAVEDLVAGLPPGAPGRAEALFFAGEKALMSGDPVAARTWLERSAAEPGEVTIDPRAELLGCFLALGLEDEVDSLLETLRKASAEGDVRGNFHEVVGEVLEQVGRFEEAERWFNIGLLALDEHDPTESEESCLAGRLRVRRQQDKPQDRLDLIAEQYRDHYRDHFAS